jgi:transcriptional regulator with XRE-family HTH domain
MEFKNIFTMKQPDLGKKILELRKQKGLTQEELVELCNINVRTIQRIENNEDEVSQVILEPVLIERESCRRSN